MFRKVPLEKLAELTYQMRLNDQYDIPFGKFDHAIDCLERYRMVVSRHSGSADIGLHTSHYFRHDKIMEFFITHAFIHNKERQLKHFGDSRFQGVYFLLAVSMPLQDAEIICEAAVNYAADTKDHSISDTFVKLLRERKIQRA